MRLITVNSGSSSLKLAVFESHTKHAGAKVSEPKALAFALVDRLGTAESTLTIVREPLGEVILKASLANHLGVTSKDASKDDSRNISIAELIRTLVSVLASNGLTTEIDAVVHRVVHGGVAFDGPVIITPAVKEQINSFTPLAPLHQPANLLGIAAMEELFPAAQQMACFDTSFHRGHPWIASTYALPHELFEAGVRRYGFHGLSVEHVARKLSQEFPALAKGRVIVAHLGSGASMCALKAGKSIASTMGFSALDGLTMGTRCGGIDPGVLLYLMQERKMAAADLSDLLYHKSGLLGLSGISSDVRTLSNSADPRAKAALDYFVYTALSAVGELASALCGIDAIVFTGGIGEHSSTIRAKIISGLAWMGASLDATNNETSMKSPGIKAITTKDSRILGLVIPADEELMMAIHGVDLFGVGQP